MGYFIAAVGLVVFIVIAVKVVNAIKDKKLEKNEEIANYLLIKARQGDTQAAFDLGLHYKNTEKLGDATFWLQKAVHHEINEAKVELDYCKCKLEEQLKKLEDFVKNNKFNNYEAIKECCTELEKSGYVLSYSFYNGKDKDCCYAFVGLRDALNNGSIRFDTHTHDTIGVNWEFSCDNEIFPKWHLEKAGCLYGKHAIQLDKAAIMLNSDIPSSEPPPEWMMICAKILAKGFTIRYPQWVEENPDAKEYVNVAFKNLGLL
ncbi:MAG: hypothetical protein FWD28_05960 [Treponema sp.]|nr:hypothetical protein [Treponema sp.]